MELYHIHRSVRREARLVDGIVFRRVGRIPMLQPDFFQRASGKNEPLVLPDRFDLLRRGSAGGHFHMNGGWLSFAGELGGAAGALALSRSPPVECLPRRPVRSPPIRCALPVAVITYWRGIDLGPSAALGFN